MRAEVPLAPKKTLRKTLPKDLEALLELAASSGDYTAVHAAIEACEPDARLGSSKYTVLMMTACTPHLARWLVARGVDVNAADTSGETALHKSAFGRFQQKLPPDVLLELGADVHRRCTKGCTPLHAAACGQNVAAATLLLAHAADVGARSQSGLTPLEDALEQLSNVRLVPMVAMVEALLAAGAKVTPNAQEFVKQAAQRFELHRAGFVRHAVDATSEASATLCRMFGVEPPPRRNIHDGKAPIVATSASWQQRRAELWALLVPSRGACTTVQGEVIRISGRISDEIDRNGGANWDAAYDAMAHALLEHLASNVALPASELAASRDMAHSVRRVDGAGERLCELAVAWVTLNPRPIALPPPAYDR